MPRRDRGILSAPFRSRSIIIILVKSGIRIHAYMRGGGRKRGEIVAARLNARNDVS